MSSKLSSAAAIVILAAGLSAPALADGGFSMFSRDYARAMRSPTMMAMMDANKDHRVSRAEWLAYHEKLFDMMDADRDGMASRAEWDALGGIGGKGTS
jgi:hypothetical protein